MNEIEKNSQWVHTSLDRKIGKKKEMKIEDVFPKMDRVTDISKYKQYLVARSPPRRSRMPWPFHTK